VPEFHAPPSAVDVCARLSLFIQRTVDPTVVLSGLGLNAVVVKVDAPDTTLTVADGVGDGPDGDPSSQAIKNTSAMIDSEPRGQSWRLTADRRGHNGLQLMEELKTGEPWRNLVALRD
jgi:hypothetical protein